MTELLSSEDVKKTLNSLKHDFLNYQKKTTPLVFFIVLFFGVFLVGIFRTVNVIAIWISLIISILILTYWLVKYFVYWNAIKTVLLSATHVLQANMMLQFKEKKVPMLPTGGSIQESFSTIITPRKATLLYILFLAIVLLNYIFF